MGLKGSLRNVSTGVSAIPDSAVAQYDATELSLSNNETVTNWPDNIGSADATGGDPLFIDDVQNENGVVRFDNDNDFLDAGGPVLEPPYTILCVAGNIPLSSGDNTILSTFDSSEFFARLEPRGNGAFVFITSGDNPQTISGINEGDTFHLISILTRDTGTERGTIKVDGANKRTVDDIGGSEIQIIRLGNASFGNRPLDGDICEVICYNQNLEDSQQLAEEEARLSDKWGISI